jgi:hypothetical protein
MAKKKVKTKGSKAVIIVDGQALMLSPQTKKLISAIEDGHEYYSDLVRKTKIPLNSMYVYVQRLRERKLVTVTKNLDDGDIRVRLVRKIKMMDAIRV